MTDNNPTPKTMGLMSRLIARFVLGNHWKKTKR